MGDQLTLMAVHAHPDDECSSTGGVLARYASEAVRTVVVTCTNGELGDGPGGIKPGVDGHDEQAVAATRRGELERACATLRVTHLEMLGYRDSGMADWTFKERPDAFANVPLDDGAARIASLFDLYRPDVVVTYEEDGAYNHPDHVHASRITMAALQRTGIPRKVYFTAIRMSRFARMAQMLRERGVEMPEMPEPDADWRKRIELAEAKITTTIDVSAYLEQKRTALAAHASQVEESFFNRLPAEAFDLVFGEESFVRVHDVTGAPVPEDDLLAGLR